MLPNDNVPAKQAAQLAEQVFSSVGLLSKANTEHGPHKWFTHTYTAMTQANGLPKLWAKISSSASPVSRLRQEPRVDT